MLSQSTIIDEHKEVLCGFEKECLEDIKDIAMLVHRHLMDDKCLFVFGNGGSAADADHLCAEMVVRFEKERKGYNVRNLACSNSIVTAAGNDYGFESIFSKQLESLSKPGDICLALSTSGKSSNVVNGLEYCLDNQVKTVLFTGTHGKALRKKYDKVLAIPSKRTAIIQQFHTLSIHLLCEMIDNLKTRE